MSGTIDNTKDMPLIKVSEDMLIRERKREYGNGCIGYDVHMFMEYCIRINHYILNEDYKAALEMVENRENYLMEMTSNTRPLFLISALIDDREKSKGKIDVSEFTNKLRSILNEIASPDLFDFYDEDFDDITGLSDAGKIIGGMVGDVLAEINGNKKELSEFLELYFEEQNAESYRSAEDDYKKLVACLPNAADRAKDLALSLAESSRQDPGNYNNDHYKYSSALVSSLHIPSECEVFLTHDHSSLFLAGRNGFAITSNGIYLIETMSSKVQHITYDELGQQEIEWKGGRFIIGDKRILFPCRERDQSLVFNFLNVIGQYCKFLKGAENHGKKIVKNAVLL